MPFFSLIGANGWRHLAPLGAISAKKMAPRGATWRHLALIAPIGDFSPKNHKKMAPRGATWRHFFLRTYLTLLPYSYTLKSEVFNNFTGE